MKDYKDKLGVKSDPAVLRIPDDPKITMGTKVKDLPDDMKHNVNPEHQDKTLGEMMGIDPKHINGDFADAKVHDFLDTQKGAGYNPDKNSVAVQEGKGENEYYHELGHAHQNENGGYTSQNTDKYLLEYHNVLEHENKINPNLRDNYRTDEVIGQNPWKKKWDDVVSHVDQMPDGEMKTNNKTMLDRIDEMVKTDPRYRPNSDAIRNNLAAEYFFNGGSKRT
jgi:hypothetical protein